MSNSLDRIQVELSAFAEGRTDDTGRRMLTLTPMAGDPPLLQVVVEGREELPIFLSVVEDQLLAVTYLFTEDEIDASAKCQMLEAMLDLNVPMPLSAFAKTDDRYIVFGALSVHSKIGVVAQEIDALSDNALEALEAMAVYLK